MDKVIRPTGLSHEDYTEKQLEHIYFIWLHFCHSHSEKRGSIDVRTLDEFIQYDYDDDPDVYGNCPCYICQIGEENYYDNGKWFRKNRSN